MRLSILLAMFLTICAVTSAAPASAATVCEVGGVATFAAADVGSNCPGGSNGASEVNALSVTTDDAGDIVFTDANTITDGDGIGGCSASGKTATCPGALAYVFDLGAGNDSATIGAVASGGNQSTGGPGADHLTGGPLADDLAGGDGNDTVDGGDGNDSLDGGATPGCPGSAGNDNLNGGAGDDALCGGTGPGTASDDDVLSGGDGQDTAYYQRTAAVNVSLDDQPGDGQSGESDNVHSDVENLVGGSGNDRLTGSNARNMLDGGDGSDTLAGLGGDDTFVASAGADTYLGGDGEDTVSYASRTSPVHVTLDGVADDGASGENDNVGSDVENVIGGSGDDTLIGSAADNQLGGGPGDDSISGGDGNDGLDGGAGRDTLDGGAGSDDLLGGPGADTLRTRDGLTDHADCGGGTDSATVDARDDVAGDCEQVDIAPPAAVLIQSVQVTRPRFVVVRIECPATERQCAGQIIVKTVRRLRGRFVKLGQINYRIRGTLSKVFRARIGAGDAPVLARARRVKLRTIVSNLNSDTGVVTSATRLTTVNTRGLRP